MRERCIADIVSTWHQILVAFPCSDNPHIAEACLDCIQRYIPWIEIELIVNDKFVPILYQAMCIDDRQAVHEQFDKVRLRAADCFFEIVYKGMPSSKKFGIIQSLKLVELMSQFKPKQEHDDFAEGVADLMKEVGQSLIQGIEDGMASEVMPSFSAVLQMSLQYFSGSNFKVARELLPLFADCISIVLLFVCLVSL
jgi:exportin-T